MWQPWRNGPPYEAVNVFSRGVAIVSLIELAKVPEDRGHRA